MAKDDRTTSWAVPAAVLAAVAAVAGFFLYERFAGGTADDGGACHGTTWILDHGRDGIMRAGADSKTNASEGDTSCAKMLPVLCLLRTGAPGPNQPMELIDEGGWARGELRASKPVRGDELLSWKAADAICARDAGPGFRVAESHDGLERGGHMWTHGWMKPGPQRYWVAVDDADANPWNHLAASGAAGADATADGRRKRPDPPETVDARRVFKTARDARMVGEGDLACGILAELIGSMDAPKEVRDQAITEARRQGCAPPK
jgi:hypothetical protein